MLKLVTFLTTLLVTSTLKTPTLNSIYFSFLFQSRMILYQAQCFSWWLLVCPCLSLSFSQTQMLCSHTLLALCCLFGGRLVLVISFHWQPEKEVKAASSCQPSCVYECVRWCVCQVCIHLNVITDSCQSTWESETKLSKSNHRWLDQTECISLW